MWSDAWIGLPYAELGRGPAYDCLGLFLALQEARQGRVLPDPACTATQAHRSGVVDAHKPGWARVDTAQEGDALLIRMMGRVLHVAYAINAREMLHTDADAGSSTIENFRSTRWRGRVEGIYRYAG
ncbi:peptidoglycan endopeptidase [Roseovarius sp. PS-C2]|uniref:peptidoglycan endopeptidase n=1 Tax=Roseovarius sp. PS-C2 TaxID=2820814 RepID=UPI001C0E5089|nr:peptidoglycan endopeptidase [Roseovarius sp. PS-C2]MBU3262057.1 peptidoglycan endopeptidase [Roseovarius sp. PS-C2]